MDLPDSPQSLWLAEYGPYQPEPSLAGDISVDVAVIGGGFLGLAAAIACGAATPRSPPKRTSRGAAAGW